MFDAAAGWPYDLGLPMPMVTNTVPASISGYILLRGRFRLPFEWGRGGARKFGPGPIHGPVKADELLLL